MKTFMTNPGVQCFETGGPNGLLRVEAGSPYSTDDQREIAVLERDGKHALTVSDRASAGGTEQIKAPAAKPKADEAGER